MADPPRDPDGNVLPHDDPDIHDEFGLLRRIPATQVIWDDDLGQHRVSTAAFSETGNHPAGGMSIDVERWLAMANYDPEVDLEDGAGLVRINTGEMRFNKSRVGSDPLPGRACHGEIWKAGAKRGKKIKVAQFEWVKKAEGID